MQPFPIKLYRTAQIREIERLASAQQGMASFVLMARAGYALYQQVTAHCSKTETVAVLCGAGNNAGDGYIVARLLLESGFLVRVYALANPDTLKNDALLAYQQYAAAHGVVELFQAEQVFDVDVIIDALFGSGLNKTVTGHYALAISAINASHAFVLAIDSPSGLNTDTGYVMGIAVKAHVTVTFIGLKQGLFTGQATDYCGKIVYTDLEIPTAIFRTQTPSALRVTQEYLPPRLRCSHKGSYGHVLIIGGEQGYTGAACLAGEAALRVGAGLVSIATRSAHASLLNINRPELMCHGVETAEQLMPLLAKASIIAIGTGLGQSAWAVELLTAVLATEKPLVVDADALNLLALNPTQRDNWVLTPHPAEAARLLNCTTVDVQQDRFAAVAALQEKYQGVAILKGAGSLIASFQEIAVSNTGNAGMATGGMGDVLTGVIAGLATQGLTLKTAAQQGVYLHGKAADLAAQQDGERGLLASDLMMYLRHGVNQ